MIEQDGLWFKNISIGTQAGCGVLRQRQCFRIRIDIYADPNPAI
jgi:hypothetical protein